MFEYIDEILREKNTVLSDKESMSAGANIHQLQIHGAEIHQYFQ